MERGERTITMQKLFQITTALGIPVRYLFSGEPRRPLDDSNSHFGKIAM
jgi:transcriptional regulator with XRE-family HTH domain